MADDVATAPIVAIGAATGHLIAVSGDTLQRISASVFATAVNKAGTAVQPSDIGSAAALEVAEIEALIDTRIGDLEAVLAAVLGPQ